MKQFKLHRLIFLFIINLMVSIPGSLTAGEWVQTESGTTNVLYGVWGTSASNVYAAAYDGILHYDGTSWSPEQLPGTAGYGGIWGSASDDIYAIGRNGNILHYDGTQWSSVDQSVTTSYLRGVWGSSETDVFVVGGSGTILHYDGSNWTRMISNTSSLLNSIWGSSENDVFAVGSNGLILHYDGRMLQQVTISKAREIIEDYICAIRAEWKSKAEGDEQCIPTSMPESNLKGCVK
jgi:photosystem II stability/assembly factor-like uncharacterized protein